jgi:hypothetical protein
MRDILEAVSLGKISIGETDFQSAVTRAIVERLEPFREEYSEQRRGDSLMRKLISFVGVEPPSSNYLKNHHDFADAVMQLMHLGLVREISQTVVFTASPAGAPFPLRFRDIEISSRGSEALSRLRFLPTSSS